jgi:hypothetical protein
VRDDGLDYIGWWVPSLDSDGVQEGWDKDGLHVDQTQTNSSKTQKTSQHWKYLLQAMSKHH